MRNYHNSQSSNQLFSTRSSSKNYIVPFHNANDFLKKEEWDYSYYVIRTLHFLHAQKYYYYNSVSLGYHFYGAFSVRPPPFISRVEISIF